MYLSWAPKVGRGALGQEEIRGASAGSRWISLPPRGHHSCLNSLVCWGPEATFELGEMEEVTQVPRFPGK